MVHCVGVGLVAELEVMASRDLILCLFIPSTGVDRITAGEREWKGGEVMPDGL